MGRLIHNLETWAPVVVVLLLAMVTTWLWRVVESYQVVDHGNLHHPDLIMGRFFSQQLGDQGQVRYTLKALRMVHYPDDDTSHFNEVDLTSYEPGNPTSEIQSLVAVRSEPRDEVVFSGDVVATRQPDAQRPLTVMKTAWLMVHPNAGTEQTDQPVVITSGQDRLNAIGMTVDNKTKVSHFNHAHIIYHPPTHQH
jgi:lipopolysaccharide export system protein LptC